MFGVNFLVNCILSQMSILNPLIDLNMYEHVNEMWSVFHFIPSHYIVTVSFRGLFFIIIIIDDDDFIKEEMQLFTPNGNQGRVVSVLLFL